MSKKKLKWVVIALVILILGLALKNVFTYQDFFQASAINCLSLLIVVGVSFFIVQRQTDQRKQKDIFIKLLESLKGLIDEKSSFDFTGLEKEQMLMRTRDISLKLEIIKKYNKKFDLEQDINFLIEKFEEYQTVIDNHSTDMRLLCQLHKELQRPLILMSQRIFDIMLNLYN